MEEAIEIVNATFHRGQAADLAAAVEGLPVDEQAEVLGEMVTELLAKLGTADQMVLLNKVLWAIMHG